MPLQVRDDEGRVHPLKAAEVERRVRELSSELALGRGSSPTSKAPPAALTIAQGLAMVLNPDGGKYPDPTERDIFIHVSSAPVQFVQLLNSRDSALVPRKRAPEVARSTATRN
ncbi:MAG: hypothetical protein ACR2M1_11270 [Gemmatimonadaceae bacterium]